MLQLKHPQMPQPIPQKTSGFSDYQPLGDSDEMPAEIPRL
jgi:hypothetical protein